MDPLYGIGGAEIPLSIDDAVRDELQDGLNQVFVRLGTKYRLTPEQIMAGDSPVPMNEIILEVDPAPLWDYEQRLSERVLDAAQADRALRRIQFEVRFVHGPTRARAQFRPEPHGYLSLANREEPSPPTAHPDIGWIGTSFAFHPQVPNDLKAHGTLWDASDGPAIEDASTYREALAGQVTLVHSDQQRAEAANQLRQEFGVDKPAKAIWHAAPDIGVPNRRLRQRHPFGYRIYVDLRYYTDRGFDRRRLQIRKRR